ncbi:hypothetical protein EU642_21780 [Salmonella enterica]|nr:hypothetical protein [Salmonella enterica]EAO0118484.1 hypothetical protein [Salmonella enterica]EAO3601704.1 hypothetical protein [Salmonella enterica]EAR6391601.1 hypothetical protein [Salmonella enterica]EAV1285246.1 hypothetical protein [Salmonella enterica]
MTDQPNEAARLPTVAEVVAILEMCEAHDLPVDKLPGLWDRYQQLEKIERRAGIQNGNMDREIARLRGLTSELDAQLRDERLKTAALETNIAAYKAHIGELQDLLEAAEKGSCGGCHA